MELVSFGGMKKWCTQFLKWEDFAYPKASSWKKVMVNSLSRSVEWSKLVSELKLAISFLRSYSGKVMHTVFKVRSVLCSYTIQKFTEEIWIEMWAKCFNGSVFFSWSQSKNPKTALEEVVRHGELNDIVNECLVLHAQNVREIRVVNLLPLLVLHRLDQPIDLEELLQPHGILQSNSLFL